MASSEPAEEWLSFSGASDEKAAAFIQNLNRRAFVQGKSKDDEWLAQYAAACLSDDALMWYYGLAEEVQNSWKKMCPALLKEFSNKLPPAAKAVLEAESDIVSALPPGSDPFSAPTPAAAPAPAPAFPASRPPLPARSPQPPQSMSNSRVGYIELADAFTGNHLGYINSKGDKTITQVLNDALLVELPLAGSPSTPVSLRMILNYSARDPQKNYAGVMGFNTPVSWWMLVACPPGNTDCYIPGIQTMTMSNVWTVHPLAETLELKILCPGQFAWEGPQRLSVGQYLPIDTIAKDYISADPKPRSEDMLCAYRKQDIQSLHGFRKVRMIFRPNN